MRTIKIILLAGAVGFAGLFAYANIRQLSLTEKLKHVKLASFNLKGDMNETEMFQLEKKISNVPGITACSLSKDGTTASVIFYPEDVNENLLTNLLSNDGKINVSQRILSTSGGCPVHKLGASFQSVIASLDVRH